MKTTIEAVSLFVMSMALCSLTVLGALGVDPEPMTEHQKQLLTKN